MINTKIFLSTSFIYLFSSLLYLCFFFFRRKSIGRSATIVTVTGVLVQALGYIVRWIETYNLGFEHSPLSFFTLYETLVFASWSMAIAYLIVEYKYRIRVLGTVIVPFVSLMMFYASLSPDVVRAIKELPAVLTGNFYIQHVVSSIMGYAAFGFSFVVSLLILLMGITGRSISLLKKIVSLLPDPEILDDLSCKAIAIGFILSSIGMATGLFRTKILWHSYWSWDPSQTFGLITWLLYALILHGRYKRWCGVKITAVLSITAFIGKIVLFLIAGNYMMQSGHYPIQ